MREVLGMDKYFPVLLLPCREEEYPREELAFHPHSLPISFSIREVSDSSTGESRISSAFLPQNLRAIGTVHSVCSQAGVLCGGDLPEAHFSTGGGVY